MPQVYAAEEKAGLKDLLSRSVATVTAPLRLRKPSDTRSTEAFWTEISRRFNEMAKDLGKGAAASVQSAVDLSKELDQPDLAYMTSILVSVGWNLNDDVFLPEEVWPARATPVHKPINVDHDDTQIIGHMVQSEAVDKDGKTIEVPEGSNPPAEFDIEVAGVLYRRLPDLADKVEEILAAAEKGELYVSMEAWFDDFSYALKDPATGAYQVVARDDQTAFLSKHLRAYGGSGEYGKYRLGRVLRNIVFAGKGIVMNPANPESIIKDVANLRAAAARIDSTDTHVEGGATDMPNENEAVEVVQAKVDELSKALDAKTKETEQAVAALEALKALKLDEQVTTLTAKVKEYETAIETLTTKAVETDKTVAEATQRAEKAEAELATIRKLETARQRLAQLSQVKKIEDTEASLKELAEMTAETFAIVLKYAGEKGNASEKSKTDETKTEDVATAALDAVQPVEEPNLQGGQADEKQNLVTVAKATANCLLRRASGTEGDK